MSTNHHYNTFSRVLLLPRLASEVNFLLLAALPKSSQCCSKTCSLHLHGESHDISNDPCVFNITNGCVSSYPDRNRKVTTFQKMCNKKRNKTRNALIKHIADLRRVRSLPYGSPAPMGWQLMGNELLPEGTYFWITDFIGHDVPTILLNLIWHVSKTVNGMRSEVITHDIIQNTPAPK